MTRDVQVHGSAALKGPAITTMMIWHYGGTGQIAMALA